jgi:hypothetical protein
MRIFYSSNGVDPILLDQEERLHWLADALRAMVAVGEGKTFPADVGRSPAPYDEVLRGLRVRKLNAGATACHIAEDRWLDLQISDADLDQLCRNLIQLQDGSHTHLYATPISIIFEAEDM